LLLLYCCCRSAEAASWGSTTESLWASGAGRGFEGAGLAVVLGDAAALKGQGSHGRGVLVSLLTRRLLPVFAHDA
jgi:hypothetical protein